MKAYQFYGWEADRIREEDVAISRSIGEIGFGLMKELKEQSYVISIRESCS